MKRTKKLYTVNGVSRDQETIIRQREYIEDHVRENICEFSRSKLTWQWGSDNLFTFKIMFYA